jgi:glycosyltransferase involved in cell wall biosynthesis
MKLILALEHRFIRTPDGSYWSTTLYPRSFWERYLTVFDRMSILARVHDSATKLDSWKRVDGAGVSVVPIPAYIGPWQYLRNFRGVRTAIKQAGLEQSAVLLRVPGMIPSVVLSCLRAGHPFGVEVVGDPYDSLSKHAVSHPLRPFFRWWFTRNLKRQCKRAACSLYLTEHALQKRYPPAQDRLSVSASESDLNDDAFVANSDNIGLRPGRRFRLIYVGTLEVLYKSPDILVAAFAKAVAQGLDAELAMVGDGRERPGIENLTQKLGVRDRVSFLGQLPGGEAIRRQLDASDLFVLPSRQEGLPKAVIEAMARGLPCISTPVGGIPELLPDLALVQPNDVEALTAKILEFARDPKLRADMAQMNLAAARRYHESILQPKRIPFFERLAALTQGWQKAQGIQV